MMPTASAAVSDVIDIARALIAGTGPRVPMLSFQADQIRPIPIQPIDDISTYYYVRFTAIDQPGVLSKISGILGDHNISIKSVHQYEQKLNGTVPIFMLTHQAREAEIQQALAKISALDSITLPPALIRIEGEL
ncbi:MAG: ACT domain-containing protein [Desulfobacterales bacterium]